MSLTGTGAPAEISEMATASVGERVAATAKATESGITGIIVSISGPSPITVNTTIPNASVRMGPQSLKNASFGIRQPSKKSSGAINKREKVSGSSVASKPDHVREGRADADLQDRQRQPDRRKPGQNSAHHDGEQQNQRNPDRVH